MKHTNKILIFAGTTEGRRLAELLDQNGIPCVVCVATEYGAQLMNGQNREDTCMEVRQGRLGRDAMSELMREEDFLAVVDATHPFAVEVSENIRESAACCGLPFFRLKRDTAGKAALQEGKYFSDSAECARYLQQMKGNILLTTGSKELAVYCADNVLRERLYVRVLPGRESLEICEKMGIPGSHILALQGPFSEELNLAILRQYQIRCLVTKESGETGGYFAKLRAARQAGAQVCVLGNPERGEGLTFGQVCVELGRLTGKHIETNGNLKISLVGIGMGSRECLTVQALETIRTADYIFGASRLLESVGELGRMQEGTSGETKAYPYYRAADILPCLEEILSERQGESVKAVVLFSGDSGFYSGCRGLYRELKAWTPAQKAEVDIEICPGISSVSYLAAAVGVSWQDAGIVSLHGRRDSGVARAELLDAVRRHERTFVLVSGAEDVRALGALLTGERGNLRVIIGSRLSYPAQEIAEYSTEECAKLEKNGICTCLILNKAVDNPDMAGQRFVTHGLPDAAFQRGEVPMTKEEIRETAICKLRLTEGAVVYDIGSGTGSVAVEIARCSPTIAVYALEHKESAVTLIRRNAQKFRVHNLTVVQTHAPEGMDGLPKPTHAFIGGSDGRLKEILKMLREKNPQMRVVVTAVSLETVAELTEIASGKDVEESEIVCLQSSRARLAGRHHLMQAENPIYIVSFTFSKHEMHEAAETAE
jgi:precorrin-6Y C5,15-methyltransferase (decarboxylating)